MGRNISSDSCNGSQTSDDKKVQSHDILCVSDIYSHEDQKINERKRRRIPSCQPKAKSSRNDSHTENSSKTFHASDCDRPQADSDNHLLYKIGDTIKNRYKVIETIGEGTFGKVLLCRDRKNQDQEIALKVIKRVNKYFKSAKIEIEVLMEILRKDPTLSHRCVRMLNHFDYHGFMCLSFEWLGESVFDFMKGNMYCAYPMSHVKAISFQLIDAVAFLHSHDIIHTDIKPENILFVSSEFDLFYNKTMNREEKILKSPEIRLIDFGSATYFEDSHSSVVSTRHYRALEVILELGWNEKCDCWSVGAIMFEIYTGDVLFQTHDNFEHLAMMVYILGELPRSMIQRTKKRKYFSRGRLDWDFEEDNSSNCRIKSMCRPLQECISKKADMEHTNLLRIIEDLLQYDPDDRISMRRCLRKSYFNSVRQIYQVK